MHVPFGISSLTLVAALVLALPLYLLIALYFYAPFKVRSNQTKEVHVNFFPIELPNLPHDIHDSFVAASQSLAALGFQSIGTACRHLAKTNQDSFISIWVNQSHNDSAQVIAIRTPSPLGGLQIVTLVTYHTDFSDDTAVVTSNSASASVFPRDPTTDAIRCSHVRDLSLLYSFHRARVARDQRGRRATLEKTKDVVARMLFEHEQTYDRLMQTGYYALDGSREYYVPTLKGAFFMTWKLLPPFKQIQKYRKDRLADRTLQELGFGGMEAFYQMQAASPPNAGVIQYSGGTR